MKFELKKINCILIYKLQPLYIYRKFKIAQLPHLSMLLGRYLGPHAWKVCCHGNPLGDTLSYLSGPSSFQGMCDSLFLSLSLCHISKPGHKNLCKYIYIKA